MFVIRPKIFFMFSNDWVTEASSTMPYTQQVNFESDDYHIKNAESLKEDEEPVSSGFEHVTERDSVKIYRKRK